MIMELSTEQKAEAYDRALKKASEFYNNEECRVGMTPVDLESIFPELKESEDEKIRKWLIHEVTETSDKIMSYRNMNKKDVLAWLEKQGEPVEINPTEFDTRLQTLIGKFDSLPKEELIGSLSFWLNIVQNNGTYKPAEKQGEQKPADKVKPKFKVGNWVIFNEAHDSVYQVERIDNYRYYLRHYLGGTLSVPCNSELIRPWTIQDAKDGDVLQLGKVTAIFKEYTGNGCCTCYCSLYKDIIFEIPIADGGDNIYGCRYKTTPATKEQRDLLFKKMKEADYKWDAKKKELKKIKNESETPSPDTLFILE